MLSKEIKAFTQKEHLFFIIILFVYTGPLPVLDSAWTRILRVVLFRNSNLIQSSLIKRLPEFEIPYSVNF